MCAGKRMGSDSHETYKYSPRSSTGRAEDDPKLALNSVNRPSLDDDPRLWSKTWVAGRDDRPYITVHAQDQWDERTPDWSRSPEYAYDHGAEVELLSMEAFEDSGGNVPDRVRVFAEARHGEEYVIAMIIVGNSMVTVYTPDADYHHPATCAYVRTLSARHDIH